MISRRPPAETARSRSATGPGRPKDPAKRAAVLQAARRLFTELGFDGTSMDAVAAAAGVSKLTVYSHFGDKDGLFHSVIQATCSAMVPDTLFVTDSRIPLRDQLLHIAQAFFALANSPEALATQRMLFSPSTDAHLRQMFWQAGPARLTQAFVSFLQPRMLAGQLAIDDPVLAASQFFCLVKGELFNQMLCDMPPCPGSAAAEQHIAASVDFFLRAYAVD